MAGLPPRCRELLKTYGHERYPDLAWNPAAYISQMTDNLRNWAERLAGARLSGAADVPGYDPDVLAQARHHNEIAPAAALWSLEDAAAKSPSLLVTTLYSQKTANADHSRLNGIMSLSADVSHTRGSGTPLHSRLSPGRNCA